MPKENLSPGAYRPSPPTSWALALPTFRPTPALRHTGPLSQLPQGPAPLTSSLIPALAPLGPAARPQDLALPTSGPAQALGLTRSEAASHLVTQAYQPVTSNLYTRRAWPATRPGASHVYETAHTSRPTTRGRPTVHRGGTPRASSPDDQRGVRCQDTQDVSYRRPLLQGQEM